ncbi:MAG TPA: hypothetical protein VGS80_15710 [Ktedonobacterales bacterium]|nr:hypothetical protein [Ktedonobacterales bacterium]
MALLLSWSGTGWGKPVQASPETRKPLRHAAAYGTADGTEDGAQHLVES